MFTEDGNPIAWGSISWGLFWKAKKDIPTSKVENQRRGVIRPFPANWIRKKKHSKEER